MYKRILISTLFCTVLHALHAQKNLLSIIEKSSPALVKIILAQEEQYGAQNGNNSNFRLDSTVRFSYNSLVELKTGITIYEYPTPYKEVQNSFSYNQTSLAWEHGIQTIIETNSTGSFESVKIYFLENGVSRLVNSITKYFSPTQTSQLDSIIMFNDFEKNIVRDYRYDATGNITLERVYTYSSKNGALKTVTEYNYSYLPNNKLSALLINEGTALNSLMGKTRYLHRHSADTTNVVVENFSPATQSWVLELYYIQIQGPAPNLTAKQFFFENTGSNWVLRDTTFFFYDAENRLDSSAEIFALPHYTPYNSSLKYTYVQENLFDCQRYYTFDSSKQSLEPYSKTQYYYTRISKTKETLLPVHSVLVYPNPANDQLQLDAGAEQILSVEVIDQMGRVLHQQHYNHNRLVSLKRGGLDAGLYMLRIRLKAGVVMKQVLFE